MLVVMMLFVIGCLPLSSFDRIEITLPQEESDPWEENENTSQNGSNTGGSSSNNGSSGSNEPDPLDPECVLLEDCCDNIPSSHSNYNVLVDWCYEAFYEMNGVPKDITGGECSSLLCGISESWVTECQVYACMLESCDGPVTALFSTLALLPDNSAGTASVHMQNANRNRFLR